MSGNSNPFPWRSRLATWGGGRIDWTLKPFETIITSRPHDLLKMIGKNAPSPRQYVWVRSSINDAALRPSWAAEPASMSLKHLSFLPFLKISTISHLRFPAPLYLRWELAPGVQNALLLWDLLEIPRSTREVLEKGKVALQGRLHPVFVEAHNGLHHGRWIHDMCHRPIRATALLIQAYGEE